jgi:hypothetical protein
VIGVIAIGGGVLVAKALVANAGLNPEKDVSFVVAKKNIAIPTIFAENATVIVVSLVAIDGGDLEQG